MRAVSLRRQGRQKSESARAGIPEFGEKLYDTDMVQRLQDGLTTVHKDMPTFRFDRQEAAAAVNYLRSIQKRK